MTNTTTRRAAGVLSALVLTMAASPVAASPQVERTNHHAMTSSSSTTHSVEYAAKVLGVNPRTVKRWAQDGAIQAERLGTGKTAPYYFTSEELVRFGRLRAAKIAGDLQELRDRIDTLSSTTAP